jgi:hypothetical protein
MPGSRQANPRTLVKRRGRYPCNGYTPARTGKPRHGGLPLQTALWRPGVGAGNMASPASTLIGFAVNLSTSSAITFSSRPAVPPSIPWQVMNKSGAVCKNRPNSVSFCTFALTALQKITPVAVKRFLQSAQDWQGRPVIAVFETLNISPIHVDRFSQRLLSQTQSFA